MRILIVAVALAVTGCAPVINSRTALSVENNSSPRIWVQRDHIYSVDDGRTTHAERELLVCFMPDKPGPATCYPTEIKEAP